MSNTSNNLSISSYEEYQKNICLSPRRTIIDYNNNPNPPKQYIDLDVGFFGQFSYQHQAWEYVLRSVRDFYPEAPIVLINDGFDQFDYTEMAKKHNCIHLPKQNEICLHWYDIKWAYEYLERVKESCELAKTEWMIHLHPDVICCDKISKYPNAALAGVSAGSWTEKSNNNFPEHVLNFIREHNPNAELNGYGWCGGSIIHVPTFMKVYQSVVVDKKWNLYELREKLGQQWTEHEDVLFSILFELEGYSYRIWLDNPEFQRGRSGLTDGGAFLHGFKRHYNLKPGENDRAYFDRCREENLKKQESYKTDN